MAKPESEIIFEGHWYRLVSDDPLLDVADTLSKLSIEDYPTSGRVRIMSVDCGEYYVEVTVRLNKYWTDL
jgi:hypothetical protein